MPDGERQDDGDVTPSRPPSTASSSRATTSRPELADAAAAEINAAETGDAATASVNAPGGESAPDPK